MNAQCGIRFEACHTKLADVAAQLSHITCKGHFFEHNYLLTIFTYFCIFNFADNISMQFPLRQY